MSETNDPRIVGQARAAISTAGADLSAAGDRWHVKPDERHQWDAARDIPPTATLRVATLGEALDLCALLVALPTPDTIEATPKRTAPRRNSLDTKAIGLPHAIVLYQGGRPVAVRFYARRRHAEAARTLSADGQARIRRHDGTLPAPSATRPSWVPASAIDYRKTRVEVHTEIVSAARQSQLEDMLGLPTGHERIAGRVYRLPGCPSGRIVFPIA